MGEISMSGSTREGGAAVIGLRASHPVLSPLLYWLVMRGFGRSRIRFEVGYRASERLATIGCRSATAGVWSGRRATRAGVSRVRGASAEDLGGLRPSS